MLKNFKDIINNALSKGAVSVAVAQAADIEVLKAVSLARQEGLVEGILIGDTEEITTILTEINEDPKNYTITHASDYVECANKAVYAVKAGQANILMKGLLPTAVFLRPILNKDNHFLTSKLISQISIFEWEKQNRLLFITDCAINILPNLEQKKEILINGLQLMKYLDFNEPRIAVIASVESININMQETIDAAALCKMAERGEFQHSIVDGPLAFDAAISEEAVAIKGIKSSIGGKADMLLMPCLNTGNAIHKALVNIAQLPTAGVILGAKVPIVSTSRSDSSETKHYSLAVAACMAR